VTMFCRNHSLSYLLSIGLPS